MRQSYENWGVEFLDLEDPPEPVRSPLLYLPMDLIVMMIDVAYVIDKTKNSRGKLDLLKADIQQNGLKNPGTLVVSSTKIKLQDGNHRFICCSELGHSKFPVQFQYTEGKIKSGGANHSSLIEFCLNEIYS